MPEIVRLGRVRICIWPGDHDPPHFHIIGAGTRALVDIRTLSVIRGRYDRRALAEAVSWAAEHHDDLRAAWSKFNERD